MGREKKTSFNEVILEGETFQLWNSKQLSIRFCSVFLSLIIRTELGRELKRGSMQNKKSLFMTFVISLPCNIKFMRITYYANELMTSSSRWPIATFLTEELAGLVIMVKMERRSPASNCCIWLCCWYIFSLTVFKTFTPDQIQLCQRSV